MAMKFPAKVEARVTQQIKKFQTAVLDAKKRDVNESDTAMIVVEMLCNILGYKKVEEITSEHAIRGLFADLAIRVGNTTRFLVEVKAVNIALKDSHVTQVVNYAANAPVEWVILTNGAQWKAYKVTFGKPIDRILVLDVDLCTANLKGPEIMEFFGSLSREVFTPNSMSQVYRTKQAMSRYSIAALLLSDPVVGMVRRELRKLADGLNPDLEDIRTVIGEQVIKRELIETDEAKVATKAVKKLAKQQARAAKGDAGKTAVIEDAVTPTVESQPDSQV